MVYGVGFMLALVSGFGFGLLGYKLFKNKPNIN
jgi:hypothetical protein